MSTEEWRPIPGWEGYYEASDRGRVRSMPRRIGSSFGATRVIPGRVISQSANVRGYMAVNLWRDNARTVALVHRLVLNAFVGLRPEGLVGCHWDDDKSNNALTNLRWDTPVANGRDRVRNGHHYLANRTHCVHGHPFAGENLYLSPDGKRHCRTCRRQREVDRKSSRQGRAA